MDVGYSRSEVAEHVDHAFSSRPAIGRKEFVDAPERQEAPRTMIASVESRAPADARHTGLRDLWPHTPELPA